MFLVVQDRSIGDHASHKMTKTTTTITMTTTTTMKTTTTTTKTKTKTTKTTTTKIKAILKKITSQVELLLCEHLESIKIQVQGKFE